MQLHMCSQSFIALPPRSPRLALLCAPYEHVRRAQPGVRPLLHCSSLGPLEHPGCPSLAWGYRCTRAPRRDIAGAAGHPIHRARA